MPSVKTRLVAPIVAAASLALALGSGACTTVPSSTNAGGAGSTSSTSGSMTTSSTSSVSSTGTSSGGNECVFDVSTFDSDCVFAE